MSVNKKHVAKHDKKAKKAEAKKETKKKEDKTETKPLPKGSTNSYETRGGEAGSSTSGMWNNTNESDKKENG